MTILQCLLNPPFECVNRRHNFNIFIHRLPLNTLAQIKALVSPFLFIEEVLRNAKLKAVLFLFILI
jgi:hypothetical protein